LGTRIHGVEEGGHRRLQGATEQTSSALRWTASYTRSSKMETRRQEFVDAGSCQNRRDDYADRYWKQAGVVYVS
jgi:hypothetical protein